MKIKIAILAFSFFIASCKKNGTVYVYKGVKESVKITLFADSSSIKKVTTKHGITEYDGLWHFINNSDSIVVITTTGQGWDFWTLIPTDTYKISGGTLIEQ